MRRCVLPLLSLAVFVSVVVAQSNEATSEPAASSRAGKSAPKRTPSARGASSEQDLFGRAITWMRKSAYAVGKGGRAYAEGLVRKTPKTFANVRREVEGLGKRVAKNGALRDLDEKRRYVAELWRLRASLDLMALLDARTLEMLTGIDAKTIASLEKSLTGVAKTLGLAPGQSRPNVAPAGAKPVAKKSG